MIHDNLRMAFLSVSARLIEQLYARMPSVQLSQRPTPITFNRTSVELKLPVAAGDFCRVIKPLIEPVWN